MRLAVVLRALALVVPLFVIGSNPSRGEPRPLGTQVGGNVGAKTSNSGAATVEPAGRAKEPASDEARLEGTWETATYEIDGKTSTSEKGRTLSFRGATLTIADPTRGAFACRFRLDAARRPKHFDLISAAKGRDVVTKGLYSIEGDTLVLCLPRVGNEPRPAALSAPAGSSSRLCVLRRVRPPGVEHAAATNPNSALRDALAGRDDDTITIVPRWKKGEEVRYEQIITFEEYGEGRKMSKNSARATIVIKVLEVNENGYSLEHKTEQVAMDDPRAATDPRTQRMLGAVEGTRLVLGVSGSGSFKGILNWDEYKSDQDKTVELLLHEVENSLARTSSKLDPEKVRGYLASKLPTKEQAEATCGGNVCLGFGVWGKRLPRWHPLVFEGEPTSLIGGGEPIPCKVELLLKSVDESQGRALVKCTLTVAPEALLAVTKKYLQDMGTRTGMPIFEDALSSISRSSLAMEHTLEWSIDTTSGWIRDATETRAVRAELSGKLMISKTITTTVRRIGEQSITSDVH